MGAHVLTIIIITMIAGMEKAIDYQSLVVFWPGESPEVTRREFNIVYKNSVSCSSNVVLPQSVGAEEVSPHGRLSPRESLPSGLG